ncbi:hypothetical protein ACFSTA_12595 [Ornithinibacillus salinisoli]|uniref:Uncharacterized protein n=1 Tax=Ornithinibacillus salinisoli TaxID=1848459 RepID=A0ABW4W378_9BACI
MSTFFGVIGLVGVIVGIVLLILGLIKKKKYKGGLITIISIVVFIVGVAMTPTEEVASDTEEEDTPEVVEEVEDTDSEVSTEEEEEDVEEDEEEIEEEPIELTPQQLMLQDIVSLIDSNQAFDTGSYTQGDIPKGDYAYIPFEGSGQYYAEKDLAGNIIDNENFDSFGYVSVHDVGNIETQGVLISAEAFETLNVSSAKEIYEVLNDLEDYKDSGWYKVGVDIPAGQYVIESFGEGYVAIMSGPVGNSEIVDNEIFNGRYTVNVTDGQFLKISSATITE